MAIAFCISGECAFIGDECCLDAIEAYGFYVNLKVFVFFSMECNAVLTAVVVEFG